MSHEDESNSLSLPSLPPVAWTFPIHWDFIDSSNFDSPWLGLHFRMHRSSPRSLYSSFHSSIFNELYFALTRPSSSSYNWESPLRWFLRWLSIWHRVLYQLDPELSTELRSTGCLSMLGDLFICNLGIIFNYCMSIITEGGFLGLLFYFERDRTPLSNLARCAKLDNIFGDLSGMIAC